MSLLDTECLKINANWLPLDVVTVSKAFSDAAAGATLLLYFQDGYPVPKTLEQWMELPVNVNDDYIGTGGHFHGEISKVLVPRVEITIHYNKFIAKEQKCNLDTLYRRYKGKDAVTGKPLPRDKASREHVIPRSLGGPDGWGNEVPMHRKANSKRGNRDYAKLGLKEPKILGAPPPLLPINSIVNKHHYEEWRMFRIPEPEIIT